MLDRFQGNIDQTSRKTVRMPGMPSTQDIRKTYEGDQQQPNESGNIHNTPSRGFMQVPSLLNLSRLVNGQKQ